jgi:conjugal transfer pilus assembly protein TraW
MFLTISGAILSGVQAAELPLKDHGVFGALFEIVEEDMIEALKRKLQKLQQSGELAAIESALKDKAKAKLETPSPVQGLNPTQEERVFTHDPTLVIEVDIKDHESHVLAHKGQRLNPLKTHKPSQGLLFIDGENKSQKQWAKQHSDQFIIILVKGKPLEVEKGLGVPIYFDQGGVLCQHYRIQQIPARIEVEGETLKVTEFKVDS